MNNDGLTDSARLYSILSASAVPHSRAAGKDLLIVISQECVIGVRLSLIRY